VSPWADKGSKRYLWNEESIARAVDYVINGQGDDLPELISQNCGSGRFDPSHREFWYLQFNGPLPQAVLTP